MGKIGRMMAQIGQIVVSHMILLLLLVDATYCHALTRSSTQEVREDRQNMLYRPPFDQEHSEIKLSSIDRRHSKRMRDHAKKQDKKSSED